MAVENNDLPKC